MPTDQKRAPDSLEVEFFKKSELAWLGIKPRSSGKKAGGLYC